MTNLAEQYSGLKLKIWTKQASGQVIVFQDGSLPDADATLKVDDAFSDGYASFGAADKPDRMGIAIDRLDCTRDGKELTFRIFDHVQQNQLALGYGDRVEFSIDQGANLAAGGAFPSWHSNTQSSPLRVTHFHGFVREFKRVRQEGGVSEYTFKAVDPIQWANEVTVVHDVGNGINRPTLIIGDIDPKKEPNDYFLGVKKLDAVPTYGWGNPRVPGLQMTTGEVLGFLEGAYGSTLSGLDIIGADLFEQSELDLLTAIPPKMVFENEGFGSVVRRILRTAYPDHDVRVDPRTRKWHFVASSRDLLHEGFTTVTTQTATNKVTVADVAAFATSGDGSSIRLVKATNPYETEIFDVMAIVSSNLTLDRDTIYSYSSGDLALPMAAKVDRVPTVQIELEEFSANNSLALDLSRSFSAIRIVGTRQKTERVKVNQTAGGSLGVRLNTNWNSSVNSSYAYSKHAWRQADRGADGDGIVIDEIGTVSGKTVIYFTMLTSAYADDHLVTDGAGGSEWTGGVVSFITKAGTNIESSKTFSKIIGFYQGWKDGPANTIRRYEARLDDDLSVSMATLQSEVADGAGNGDRFEISHADMFSPTNPNGRWTQGRVFHLENTTAADEAQYFSDLSCPARATQPLAGQTYAQQAQSVYRGQPGSPQTQQEVNDYWNLTPTSNPLGGQARAWFLPSRTPPPPAVNLEVCAPGPAAAIAPPIEIEFDKYTFDVFQSRIPETGHAGGAYWLHSHQKELIVSFDSYESASQDTQFAAIAESLWRRLSGPQFTGEVELYGCVYWLPLSDLGFRTTFGPGGTGGPSGVSTEQSRFFGLVQTISYEFATNTTNLSFDSRAYIDEIAQNLFEKQFVSETAEMRALREEVERIKREQECARKNPPLDPPPYVPSCNVFGPGGESGTKSRTKIEVKQDGLGTGDTQLGAPPSGGASGGNTGSLGFHPSYVVERDWLGVPAAFSLPYGAYYGGSESGERFIPDAGSPVQWTPLPIWSAQGAQALQETLWGVDQQTPGAGVRVEIAAGSTATVLQLANTIHNDGRYDDGFLEFSGQGFEARPPYTIASHTATTITLASAMSESIPTEGMVGKVWPERLPLLDPTDFPPPAQAFMDTAGNWFVAVGGQILSAEIVGGVLVEKTSSPNEAELAVGQSNANVTVVGDWDFSGATVTGIGGGSSPTTTAGDIIVRGASADQRLAKGSDDQVLTVVSGNVEWANAASGFSNPMTTAEDIIVGGASGAAARLAKGTDGQVLTIDTGIVAWADAAASSPTTTLGDIIRRGASADERYGIGSAGQVLTVVSGEPAWAALPATYATPTTTEGDLIVRGSSADGRLGKGATGQYLRANATTLEWATAPWLTSPNTTEGDIILRGASADGRLPRGTNGQYLKATATTVVWDDAPWLISPTGSEGDIIIRAGSTDVALAVGSNGDVLTVSGGYPSWQAPGTDPITTQGDIIVGDSGGSATRLPLGPSGYYLFSDGTDAIWSTLNILSNSVGTSQLATGGVTEAKLADDAVTEAKILDDAVTETKLADSSVTTAKIADANVTSAKLATDSVTTIKIADANVTNAKIADTAVTAAKIDADAVTTSKIDDLAVTADKLAADSVTNSKIEDGAISQAKLDANALTLLTGLHVTASGYYTAANTPGQVIRFFHDNTDNDLGIPIPAGKTLYVLGAYVRAKTGSNAGTYTVEGYVRRIEVENGSGTFTDYLVVSGSSASTSVFKQFEATGTIASPIATIPGGSGYRFILAIKNGASSPGNFTSAKHSLCILGVIA